jgi:hypothetical protein
MAALEGVGTVWVLRGSMVQDLEQRGMLGAAQAGELLLVVAEGLRGEELGNQ